MTHHRINPFGGAFRKTQRWLSRRDIIWDDMCMVSLGEVLAGNYDYANSVFWWDGEVRFFLYPAYV